jgi:hypothetical protein
MTGRQYVLSFTVCDTSNDVVLNLVEALAMYIRPVINGLKRKKQATNGDRYSLTAPYFVEASVRL